jgi:hypothetical protein
MHRYLFAAVVALAATASVAVGQQPSGQVAAIKVQPDRAPDCSSLKAIVESVTRECKTNDERAIAIYNFCLLSHYHRQYPTERGGIPVLKDIHTYGWSLCGGLHAIQSALWRELGWSWRFVGWSGHTTVEAGYDDRWHYLDVFLKFYAWMPDPNAPGGRTIAGEDDLTADPEGLIGNAFSLDPSRNVVYARDNQFELIGDRANWTAPPFLVCGDTIADTIAGLKTHRPAGSPEGWGGIVHATGAYSANVDLAPGFSLTNTWAPLADDGWYWEGSTVAPTHTCGNKDLRNDPGHGMVLEPYYQHVRGFCNGTLRFDPDFGNDAFLRSLVATDNVRYANASLVPVQADRPASITVLLKSPYVMTKAHGEADGADALEVSVDGGRTFRPADLGDFTAAVKGQVAALARISFAKALRSLRLQMMVQNNPGALPYLSPGRNVITVSAADAAALGDSRLVVTYAYAPGYRTRSPEQLCLAGAEVARQHGAHWDESPTVVQKVFGAKDLPATFELDVPTPRGAYPVYPRMIFVRREVISPTSQPLPLPADAQPPRMGPDDELKTLPNPFMMGTQPPPQRTPRPIRTDIMELQPGHFVTRTGAVPTTDFLKWPKTAGERVDAIVFLIGGTLQSLPTLKDLAAARLVFPAIRAHQEAPTKVGVVALKAPFEPGEPYDFAGLGDVIATAVVPKMAADVPNWDPPREFKIDVTRALRMVAAGDVGFHGFALRVVPDRGVDDGWTVRINLPRQPHVYLEVDSYTDPGPPGH